MHQVHADDDESESTMQQDDHYSGELVNAASGNVLDTIKVCPTCGRRKLPCDDVGGIHGTQGSGNWSASESSRSTSRTNSINEAEAYPQSSTMYRGQETKTASKALPNYPEVLSPNTQSSRIPHHAHLEGETDRTPDARAKISPLEQRPSRRKVDRRPSITSNLESHKDDTDSGNNATKSMPEPVHHSARRDNVGLFSEIFWLLYSYPAF